MQHLEPRKRGSTPAVVPGAAPALAKAGVGGYIHNIGLVVWNIWIFFSIQLGSSSSQLLLTHIFQGQDGWYTTNQYIYIIILYMYII